MEIVARNVGEQRAQTGVDTGAVHVAAHGWQLNSWLNLLGKSLLGKTHESLFDGLIGDRGLVGEVFQFGWDIGKNWVGWVLEVIIVQEASVRFGNKFASWCVEGHVVEAIKRCLELCMRAVCAAVCNCLQLCLAFVVCLVARIYGLGVALDGELAIDDGVLARKIRLVEIIGVGDVAATLTRLEDDWSIWANEESDHARTSSRSGVPLLVESDITSDNDSVAAVPAGGLDPVHGVKNGVGSAVACIDGVDTLNICVVLEQLHKNRLDRFGLVQESLGSHLQPANGVQVDVVLFDERGEDGEGEGVDVFAVVAEAHLGLAEANGVFALGHAIKLLELCLVDTLRGEVDINGLDPDIGGARRHGGIGIGGKVFGFGGSVTVMVFGGQTYCEMKSVREVS